jgi:hypothetical protein
MSISRFFAAAILALVAVSCAPPPTGDFRFLESGDVPEGKAVVYLYRPPSLLGTIDVCNMEINGDVVGALDAAHYTHVFVDPGKTRFQTTGSFQAFVTVNLREGGEYFIRQTWVFHQTGLRPKLEHMTRIAAEPELVTCSLVEAPPIIDTPDEELKEAATDMSYKVRRARAGDLETIVAFTVAEAAEAEGADKDTTAVRRGVSVGLSDASVAAGYTIMTKELASDEPG